jgi:thiol-disulfide isomerase/thioredoxin
MISPDAYSQSGKIPPFKIIQSDGKIFKAENLPMGKPIIIIYFSPDCEECQKLTEGLLKRMNDFKKASIVMVTYLAVDYVKQFVSKYNLNRYPNIFVGTEGSSFIVRYYYNVQTFPFLALINKDGNLVKIYKKEKEEDIEDLSNRLKDL